MMMKRMDLFCPAAASTDICLSTTDQSSYIVHGGGGRAIDRHNPHLRDNRRRSSTASHFSAATAAVPSSQSQSDSQPHKRSSKSKNKSKISSCAKRCDRTISPPGSTRYLLSDTTGFVDDFDTISSQSSKAKPYLLEPDGNHVHSHGSSSLLIPTTQPPHPLPPTPTSTDDQPPHLLPPTPTSTNDHQVVVLRVSLHCRGCEGKVRKHLSKMKGVTSFNIDFAMKKVTVIGDVTPVGVLASISRVKNAQFWPSLSSSSSIQRPISN